MQAGDTMPSRLTWTGLSLQASWKNKLQQHNVDAMTCGASLRMDCFCTMLGFLLPHDRSVSYGLLDMDACHGCSKHGVVLRALLAARMLSCVAVLLT